MKLKRALLVGIDQYKSFPVLAGCVNDVQAVGRLLANNVDGSANFECMSLTSQSMRVDRRALLKKVDLLLAPGADVALFYFAGHGVWQKSDVILVTADGNSTDPGVSMSEVLGRISRSKVEEVVIILDCCHSGGAGALPTLGDGLAVIPHGTAILSAARADQPVAESSEGGEFTAHLRTALEGGAADVDGNVTVAGMYGYLSRCFGAWGQRPMLKANLDRLVTLRQCVPAVALSDLRYLPRIFSVPDQFLALSPPAESATESRHAEHEEVRAIMQRYRAASLVEPAQADAAADDKEYRLTALGRHYWTVAVNNRL